MHTIDKISFVILTWNSAKTIAETLTAVKDKCEIENTEYEIFIVDNGSTDCTLEIIEEQAESLPVDLTRLPKNYGTTRTRNMALRKCTGNIICILDSDASFIDGSIRGIAELLLSDKSIGIVAPKMLFPDDTIQESVRKFPSMFGKFSKIPGIIFKFDFKHYDGYEGFPFEETTEVDYAISACWFFRREILDDVGYLDERIFYSPEDIDFGIRIWSKGMKTLYYPGFTVCHHVQRITHKKSLSRIAISHLFGLIYFFMKHRYFRKPRKNNKR